MNIDPYLYAGASIFAAGMVFKVALDLLVPYVRGWLARLSAHKKHQQLELQGKVKQPQPSLQANPTIP